MLFTQLGRRPWPEPRLRRALLSAVTAILVIAGGCSPRLLVDHLPETDGSLRLTYSAMVPSSPSTTTAVSIIGEASTGVSTVKTFSDASCSTLIGTGTYANFISTGVPTFITANTTTTVYGRGYSSGGVAVTLCTLLVTPRHDNIAPLGSFSIDQGSVAPVVGFTNSTTVSLTLAGTDTLGSGLSEMYITNTAGCAAGGTWENYATTRAGWIVAQTNGTATVYAKFKDVAGNISSCLAATITHDSVAPGAPALSINGGATATASTGVTLALSATGIPYQMAIEESGTCSATPTWLGYSTSTSFTLSAGVGVKTLAAQFRDAAGNISACVTSSITYNPSAPTIAIDSGAAYTSSFTRSVNLDLTAAGYTQMYVTNTAGCAAGGAWEALAATKAWTLATANALNTVYVRFWDGAAGFSACINATITHDDISPAGTSISINGGASTTKSTAVTLTLAATDTNPLFMAISNAPGCTGTWEAFSATKAWTLGSSNGTAQVNAKFQDAAGNDTGCMSFDTIQLDTVAPTLAITTPVAGAAYKGGVASSITWTATDATSGFGATPIMLESSSDGGATWTTIVAATANTGSYAWTPPVTDSIAYQIRLTATDVAGNTTQVNTGNFTVDSTAPLFTSSTLVINSGNATATTAFIPVSFSATEPLDPIASGVAYVCFKTSSAGVPTAPVSTDPCFAPLSSVANSVTITDAQAFLGSIGGNYTVYAWLKDRAGNVSALTSAGSGTTGTDKASITFTPPTPPSVTNVIAANTNASANPPTNAEMTYTVQNLYVKWTATANGGATLSSIDLSYTTNGTTFTTIASGQINGTNGTCTFGGSQTGCYQSVNIPALNGVQFQVRVSVTDSNGQIASSLSLPFNTGTLRILAGNTDLGINGSASAAVLQSVGGSQQFVVLSNGDIYLLGNLTVGLFQIKQSDGILRLLAATTGTASGDGGLVSAATLRSPSMITADINDNIYIFDYDRIRKITTATMVIDTIIGGGGSTADTIADPKTLSITGLSAAANPNLHRQIHVLPDGRIIFRSSNYPAWNYPLMDGTTAKFRVYTPASGITTYYPQGTGDANNAATVLSGRASWGIIPVWSPGTSSLLRYMSLSTRSTSDGTHYCTPGSLSASDASAVAPHPPLFAWEWTCVEGGANISPTGQIYLAGTGVQPMIYLYNLAANTWDIYAGTTTAGLCADGTDRLSCNMSIRSAYLAANGQMYFIEAGRIRTFDGNGKVATIFGQSTSFGDGGSALSARFNLLNSVQYTRNGAEDRLYLYDRGALNIRRAVVDGQVTLTAGTGTRGSPALGSAATGQPLHPSGERSKVVVNSADSYLFMDDSGLGSILRLDLGSGLWARFSGGGATGHTTADGLANTAVSTSSRPSILGTDGTNIFVKLKNGTDLAPTNLMYKSYPMAGGNQSHIAGVTGATTPGQDFCANGTGMGVCQVPDDLLSLFWDSITSSWVAAYYSNGPAVRTWGATLSNLTTLTNTLQGAWAFKRTATDRYIFYCNSSGVIKRKTVTGGVETTLITLPTGMTCAGLNMEYSTQRDSLIFIFQQNGLYGVAEVTGAAP
jgi:hypothetical protein